MITYLKNKQWAKAIGQGKVSSLREKGKTLTLCSNLEHAVGDDVVVDVDVDG
jgi:hypothetical protein